MNTIQRGLPPLLGLLMELRTAGVTIDIQKFLLLLQALRGGFGTDPLALRAVLHHLLSSSLAARRMVDINYDRFLAQLDGSSLQPSAPSEAAPPQNRGSLTDESRVAAADIEEALTLLRSEDLAAQPDERRLVVQQLIDVSSDLEAADMLEPAGLAINPRDYMPITRRQMRQNWRYLRVPVREGPAVEFSTRETLKKIVRAGQFADPVLVPRRVSRSDLALLVDVHGSMSPFHELARRLTQTAVDGGRFRNVRTLYFHNAPDDYLMKTPAFTEAISLAEFTARAPSRWCSIVIVSDAGAARGSNNPMRVNDVSRFIQVLHGAGYRLVWLNPVPQNRWASNSAGRISRFVPMYELSRQGFDRAIASLRKSVSKPASVSV